MTRTNTNKLVARVVGVTNLSELFPAPVLKGHIGLDVRVERGSLSAGKKVWLSGPGFEEEVEIVGIEMLSDAHDPNVVRVHCSKLKVVTGTAGMEEGWILTE